MYEKSRPDILYGPGGYLDVTNSLYEVLPDQRTVRVRDSMFKFSRDEGVPYQVKLEAAKVVGYRAMYMGSIKDPILTGQLEEFLAQARRYVKMQHKEAVGTWELDFHKYGPDQDEEVLLIGEALASSQELAASVVSCAKIATIVSFHL